MVGKRRELSYSGWKSGPGPASREATVNLKQVLGWAAVAFILFYLIKEPTGAAHVVRNIGNFLSSAAHGFSSFLTSL
jgi:hypothetical protein